MPSEQDTHRVSYPVVLMAAFSLRSFGQPLFELASTHGQSVERTTWVVWEGKHTDNMDAGGVSDADAHVANNYKHL
jgi:hypothetical protein